MSRLLFRALIQYALPYHASKPTTPERVITMAKTEINKADALASFPTWTPAIKKAAQEHIKRLGGTTFFDHGGYVSVANKEGKVVMYLTAPQFQWRKEEFAPEGAQRNATLFFEPTGAERPVKEKAAKPAKKAAAKKVTVKKPTADDVDAALANA